MASIWFHLGVICEPSGCYGNVLQKISKLLEKAQKMVDSVNCIVSYGMTWYGMVWYFRVWYGRV